ncbi:hypothetical protein GCM10022206_23550 [Streptomyces chiangmaiensis]
MPTPSDDPRVSAALESPLHAEEHSTPDTRLRLVHCTTASGLRVAAAADHIVHGPASTQTSAESGDDVARLTVITDLKPGETLRLEKFISYGWSGARSLPALRDQVEAALSGARSTGWLGLVDQWGHADVEVDGDAEIQQAVRFALFHVLQAAARSEGRAILAKGLTGSGYDGHAFWDTEIFVLPLLTFTHPRCVAEALRWRQNTLPAARVRARQLGLRGAAFPWRTIDGSECSGCWPAGTAAFHVNADVAHAVIRYLSLTDGVEFERKTGVELLVETARLWHSLGHHDSDGRFHIDGVTGPDEYSAVVHDNVYTNLMAQENLRAAADAAERHREQAAALGVDEEETAAWRDAAEAITVPYNSALGIHEQPAASPASKSGIPRRPAHRLAGGLLDRAGSGLRGHALPRGNTAFRSQAAREAQPAGLLRPRAAAVSESRDHRFPGHVHPDAGRTAPDQTLRRAVDCIPRHPADTARQTADRPAGALPTTRTQPQAPRTCPT